MSKRYVTPKGKDEREIPYPSTYTEAQINELKRLGIKFIDWNGTSMAVGPGMSTEFFDEISRRKKERMSCILALLGSPGRGKTWAGLRLCEILDKKFDVKKQVCFSRDALMKIISGETKIEPGQAVLLDEAHMALGARHWWEEMQQDLVDQVATIRSMGIILIIVVLHISMIDKILRSFTLTYQLHMESRGVVTQYRVIMPRFESESYHPRESKIGLAIPGVDECASPECLWCPDRDKDIKGDSKNPRFLADDEPCMTMRARYERLKQAYLTETREEAVRKAGVKKLGEDPAAKEKDMFQLAYDNKEMLKYTRGGTIDPASIQEIFSKEDRALGVTAATNMAKRLLWRYPDLKPDLE